MENSKTSQDNEVKRMKLKQLCVIRSGQKLLQNLTLDLPGTGVTVLLGANGAGKSTLLNVMSGISEFDSGEIFDLEQTSVCLMPEPAVFYPQLTVKEQLSYTAHIFDQGKDLEVVESALKLWQLQAVSSQLTQHLSLGYRQRLSLAQMTVSGAVLWLLDEPMNGMDPEVLMTFKQQIKKLKSSKAIIMATHIMHEAQDLADWVVVMHQGRAVFSEAYDNKSQFHDLYQQAISNMSKQPIAQRSVET